MELLFLSKGRDSHLDLAIKNPMFYNENTLLALVIHITWLIHHCVLPGSLNLKRTNPQRNIVFCMVNVALLLPEHGF